MGTGAMCAKKEGGGAYAPVKYSVELAFVVDITTLWWLSFVVTRSPLNRTSSFNARTPTTYTVVATGVRWWHSLLHSPREITDAVPSCAGLERHCYVQLPVHYLQALQPLSSVLLQPSKQPTPSAVQH